MILRRCELGARRGMFAAGARVVAVVDGQEALARAATIRTEYMAGGAALETQESGRCWRARI
eukprot:8952814-Heterocapsa_arctica.AAC.1